MNYYYADAIATAQPGQAIKRPRWRGYIKKGEVAEDGSFDLTFVKKNGTQVVYHVDKDGKQTTDTPLTFTGAMNSDMMSNDWLIGDAEDFKEALDGDGEGEF